MKVLLYSHLFFPSVGGIETIADQMADNFVKLGHECTVITSSVLRESDLPDTYTYQVVRAPSLSAKIEWIKRSDIVYSNGASVNLFWLAFFIGKPFVWTHQGYQLNSIDGLGWVEGKPAPISPVESLKFHLKHSGLVYALSGYLKLLHRRLVGKLVNKNVAVTSWVAYRQPLPRQIVLHTPYRTSSFSTIAEETDFTYDFFFVGRLVSEKGVATLLHAFQLVLEKKPDYTGNLLIIGDGTWRGQLENLAEELRIAPRVHFVGKKIGSDLLHWVAKGKIAVIPSEWEEPMGGVAIEMLAAGKPTIVSRKGGMAECVGEGGMVFENGHERELAAKMISLLDQPELSKSLRIKAKEQLKKLDPLLLTQHYVSLFESFIPVK